MGQDRVRVSEQKCLNCGMTLNALGTGDKNVEAQPRPGDLAICIHCAGVMMLDDRLQVRGMTEEEAREVASDLEGMREIAQMTKKIHIIKHLLG